MATGFTNAALRDFVSRHNDRLRVVIVLGYCPGLIPQELLNQEVKSDALGKCPPTNKAVLVRTVRKHLHRRQKQPHDICNIFYERNVRAAT
jgi:hypothetical protein